MGLKKNHQKSWKKSGGKKNKGKHKMGEKSGIKIKKKKWRYTKVGVKKDHQKSWKKVRVKKTVRFFGYLKKNGGIQKWG